jgi:hypothetical protein
MFRSHETRLYLRKFAWTPNRLAADGVIVLSPDDATLTTTVPFLGFLRCTVRGPHSRAISVSTPDVNPC